MSQILCVIGCDNARIGLQVQKCFTGPTGISVMHNTASTNDLQKFVAQHPEVLALVDAKWAHSYRQLRGVPHSALLAPSGDLPQTRLLIVSIVNGQSSREIAQALKMGAIDYFRVADICQHKYDVINRVVDKRPVIEPAVAEEIEKMIALYTDFSDIEKYVLHEIAIKTKMQAIITELNNKYPNSAPYSADRVATFVHNILLRLQSKR